MARAEGGGREAAVGAVPRPGSLRLRNDAGARELMAALVWWLAACCLVRAVTAGNPDAKRLYDDLLSNYNKLVRPVVNTTDVLRVCIKLKLSQLIDVVSLVRSLPNRDPRLTYIESRVHCECNGCTCASHLVFK